MRRLLLAATLLLGLSLCAPAWAIDPIHTGTFSSTALGGFDAVAYFEEGRPVKGSSDHQLEWSGATWRFSSARNLASFKARPEAYAAQYGGYCAYAVANGATAPGDPEVWRIVDGKLYLNLNQSVADLFSQDVAGYIARADANSPGILAGN